MTTLYPRPNDEIVTTMSESDWNYLLDLLHEAAIRQRSPKNKRTVWLINKLAHNADTLTLAWLDRKRKEFP